MKGLIYLVASGGGNGTPSVSRMTRRRTSKRGTNIEVTNRGMAYKITGQYRFVQEKKKWKSYLCGPEHGAEAQNSKATISFASLDDLNIK